MTFPVPEPEPKKCPVCSARLETDGVCLICLLNDGLELGAAPVTPEPKPPFVRTMTLPCDFAGYRLVREIASGGMGIVYEAQDVKLKRVVALKVIRNAIFATREEAARFQSETQAVAQLDHPDIVPIYEGGEEDGVPFYTMRLAEGGSLADRLKKRGVLPDREAAEMMSRVARAVQHAHDHGVLHRDLKPANILLDAAGKPMLSDFGLAKLLDAEFQLTRTQAHVGTPHYMSPEQAAGRAKQITTASDVWALGVMLYQMLADKLPFQGGSAVEVMRRITEEEPEISSTGKLVTRSKLDAAVPKLAEMSPSQTARIQPDLATLILRCLEKQPARRLPGAGFLADELDRFLEGKPLFSRPVGSLERMWKLALRNKAAAFAILATSVSLIAGTAVSLWQAVKAREAEKQALLKQAEAESVADMILGTVNDLDTLSTGRRVDVAEMREQLLERMHAYKGDPLRKASLLNGLHLILTDPKMLESCEQALAEAEKLAGPDDLAIWNLRFNLAAKLVQINSRREDGVAMLRRVLAWERLHVAPISSDIIFTLVTLGEGLTNLSDAGAAEAVGWLEEACHLVEENSDLVESYAVRCRFAYTTALFRAGRRQEALELGRVNCAKAVDLLGQDHLRTALTFEKHARNCRDAGLLEEATTHANKALDSYWASVGPGDDYAKTCLRMLAEMLLKNGDAAAHMQLMQDALRVCDQQLGPLHATTLYRVGVCIYWLEERKQQMKAFALGEEWLARVRLKNGSLPPVAEKLLRTHALTLRNMARHAPAERAMRELLALTAGPTPVSLQRFADLSDLAETLLDQNRPGEALPVLREVVAAFGQSSAANQSLTKTEFPLAQTRLERAQKALGR